MLGALKSPWSGFWAREIIEHVDWVDTEEFQDILRQDSSIEIPFVFGFSFSMVLDKTREKLDS